ncbi:M20 peptidase aminoacylase family protein [Bacillus sp. V3B]|uniref:M20 peptidase aminoacylase family protein n=1 Tax=Bacillus sp. V3B TaxID=2804915 RepID=UPI00210D2621|nr:M20 peptidase aminoacylase family protein [Bacillus sp. V3B]MCQ6276866.1 M20 peptidase aminoacylase family protein [Bacillus sp. V3B]
MKQALQQIEKEIFSIFDHLHQNPEISWKEVNTTQFLKEQLEKEGYRVQTFSDCTGVVGEIGEGDFTVAVRADIDALWQEKDGKWQANHSCGHDSHSTMLLGVMKLFNRMGYKPPGKLKVIFQPAEEKGAGALKMLEKKILDDVDYLYGVHLRPIQELRSGYASPAILHGASQFITGEIKGETAHGARPHLGVNAIEVASSLVQEISKIHVDPQIPASIKMTAIHAGGASGNTIPDRAEFSLDLRAQTNDVMNELEFKLTQIIEGLSMIYDADIKLHSEIKLAAATVDLEAQQMMKGAIQEVLGQEYCAPPVVTSGGEDFHFYSLMKEDLKTTMLGLGCDLQPGLHHPNMTFHRKDMLTGIQILATTVIHTFQTLTTTETKPNEKK